MRGVRAGALGASRRSPREPTTAHHPDREAERILAGIGLIVLAGAVFTALDATTKVAVGGGTGLHGGLVSLRVPGHCHHRWSILPLHGVSVILRTAHPLISFFARCPMLLLNTVLTFISLRFMPLAEYTSTVLLAPLVVTLLAAMTLKEQVSALRWTLVAGAFVGTLVILRPDGRAFGWPTLLPLAVVVANAAFQILTGKLVKD